MSTVLIVHGRPGVDVGWYRTLEASGHVVIGTQEVDEGVAILRDGGVEVLVADDPSMATALPAIVAALSRLPDAPPFLLVSSSPDAPELSARYGAASFLPKPCSALDLCDAVARVLAADVVHAVEDAPTDPLLRELSPAEARRIEASLATRGKS